MYEKKWKWQGRGFFSPYMTACQIFMPNDKDKDKEFLYTICLKLSARKKM